MPVGRAIRRAAALFFCDHFGRGAVDEALRWTACFSLPAIICSQISRFPFRLRAISAADVDVIGQIDVDFDARWPVKCGATSAAAATLGPIAVAVAPAIDSKYGCIGSSSVGRRGVAADGEAEIVVLGGDVLARARISRKPPSTAWKSANCASIVRR